MSSTAATAPILLYGFGPTFGMPDASPFVSKVLTYLRMIDVPHQLLPGDARKAPKGKLPYIEDRGQKIPDSSFIVEYLRKNYRDLDAGLTAQERALCTAVQSMLEEHMYFVILCQRWVDDHGWRVVGPGIASVIKKAGVPGLVAPTVSNLVRKQVVKVAMAQGMGRHSMREVEDIGIRLIDSLAELAGDKPYFLGDAPHAIDATVFPFVWTLAETPIEGRLRQHIQSKHPLVAYCQRMKTQYFKDYV